MRIVHQGIFGNTARQVPALAMLVALVLCRPASASCFMDNADIALYQKAVSGWATGEKIAFWAGRFLDTPYDTDPLGVYVRREAIVADDRVDCMYLTFRAVELGLSSTPEEAQEIALDRRFHERGRLEEGRVVNYAARFEYGEDMIDSGKWGNELTSSLGKTTMIKGTRGRGRVAMIAKKDLVPVLGSLRSGDLVFFVTSPQKRTANELIGHIGIIKVEAGEVYLIHASGIKNRSGAVRQVPFSEYVEAMPFIGVRISRLQ
ncbi:MAG: hypothetical protein OHK006_12300 [Thermodesulfovibrionales bacterium]